MLIFKRRDTPSKFMIKVEQDKTDILGKDDTME